MRVFFLSYAYEEGLAADAGGFRKLWELGSALKRLGSEVLVLYPNLPGHRALMAVPCRAYPVLDLTLLRPVTAYVSMVGLALAIGRRRRPDVVYFRSGLNVLPLLLKRALGARVVLEVNGDTIEFLRREGANPLARWMFRLAEGVNARRSDRIVALTPGLKQMLVARYGIAAAKVSVIPSGTDPDHFAPEDPARARQRIGLDPDRPLIGFVGLFYRHQGVPTLLEAIVRLRATFPTLAALIVGDGVMRAAWESLAHRLGIADAVHFPGQVPYREVPTYLNALDVVAAPFTADRGETSPFKILDALACGRPVVASDLPSVRDLAERSGGAVLLTPPDDAASLAEAVAGLLANRERRHRLGAQGRAFVLASHTWDLVATALEAAVEGLRHPPALDHRPGHQLPGEVA